MEQAENRQDDTEILVRENIVEGRMRSDSQI
jgi:hypothetical protein